MIRRLELNPGLGLVLVLECIPKPVNSRRPGEMHIVPAEVVFEALRSYRPGAPARRPLTP